MRNLFTIFIVLLLFIGVSFSQQMLNVDQKAKIEVKEKVQSTKERGEETLYKYNKYTYPFYHQFNAVEFIGDTLIDITYDLLRGSVSVYSRSQPESVSVEVVPANGYYRAMQIQFLKGFAMRKKKGSNSELTTWHAVFFGFAMGVGVYWMVAQYK